MSMISLPCASSVVFPSRRGEAGWPFRKFGWFIIAPRRPYCCSTVAKLARYSGLGARLDRADDPLQRIVVLPGMEEPQPHEMLGVGVLGIDSEGLLATGARIEMPSVPEIRKARFAESGRCAHRCSSPVHGERHRQWRQRLLTGMKIPFVYQCTMV